MDVRQQTARKIQSLVLFLFTSCMFTPGTLQSFSAPKSRSPSNEIKDVCAEDGLISPKCVETRLELDVCHFSTTEPDDEMEMLRNEFK